MKGGKKVSKWICSICGYVYDEAKEGKAFTDLPDTWVCPWCGAPKSAFVPEKQEAAPKAPVAPVELDGDMVKLSAGELSALCSNLARGCEKQYLPQQEQGFRELAAFFRSKAEPAPGAGTQALLELVERDLSAGYPYANGVSSERPDRGALRALVWSEKVTRMLQSLLGRYQAEGDKMLEGTGVYVCSVCGFVFVGDAPPELCPVCKVPSWKFERVERGV